MTCSTQAGLVDDVSATDPASGAPKLRHRGGSAGSPLVPYTIFDRADQFFKSLVIPRQTALDNILPQLMHFLVHQDAKAKSWMPGVPQKAGGL